MYSHKERPERSIESLEMAQGGLVERIARWTTKDGNLATMIPRLSIFRFETPTEQTSYLHEPSICLIAQGAKRVLLGEEEYVYDAHHFLMASVNLPVIAQIIEASAERPYLGLTLKIDQREIAQLMVDRNLPAPRTQQTSRGMAVSEVSLALLNAFQRLFDLLEEPEDIPILMPLIQKEILYRLLVGEQGARLRQIAAAGSHSQQIAQAIDWLKEHFTQPFRAHELAAQVGMSNSAFYHHFRALTSMSPLQFQKWMRLHEARRLMLTDRLDAATVTFQVGYQSPSQFSREYRRLFGGPPLNDIKKLHEVSSDGRI